MKPSLLRSGLTVALLSIGWLSSQTKAAAPDDKLQAFLQKTGVTARLDQPYAGNTNPRQMLDLYLPPGKEGAPPRPVIAFIHGGGWINGDRKGGQGMMISTAAGANCVTVGIGYRLSDEAKWPAQIHDCKAAIRWIRAHAKEYNLDPDHIAVWGSSAGGHLATLLGTSGGVKELEGNLGEHTDQSSRVTCVVNFCGPQDFILPLQFGKDGKPVEHDPAVEGLLGGDLVTKRAEAIQASPATYVTPDDAPTLTAHGTKDLRVAFTHAERIHEALTKAGVKSVFIPVTDGGHGFKSDELTKRILQFLSIHLKGAPGEVESGPVPNELKPKS